MLDHWLMAVDTEKAADDLGAWADRNKVRLPGPGFTMVILDAEGKVLGQSTSDELSTDGELNRRLVMEFAKKYAPTKPDGKKLFDEAMARAKAEGKKVLLDLSAPYCGPCYAFEEYLEANKELIARDYVCVTLDWRFAGANDILARLKAATSTPWIAILDADGKVLATSDGPDGNVGFEKPQWEKMLRATASKLTAEQIASLLGRVKE
jgi:thiol-disulfide isomerase/thioredoxin